MLKNFSSAAWHALWVEALCLHRCIIFAPPVHPVPLGLLSPALQIAPVLGHRCIQCQPVRPVLPHRFIRCYCLLQNSSNSTFLWVFSSYFALLGLFTSSLGSRNGHLTNSLVPLIATITKITRNGLNGPCSLQVRILTTEHTHLRLKNSRDLWLATCEHVAAIQHIFCHLCLSHLNRCTLIKR